VAAFQHDYPTTELLALFDQQRAAGKHFTVLTPPAGGRSL